MVVVAMPNDSCEREVERKVERIIKNIEKLILYWKKKIRIDNPMQLFLKSDCVIFLKKKFLC